MNVPDRPRELKFTLLADGSTDVALVPVLSWLLQTRMPDATIASQFAETTRARKPPRGLAAKIRWTFDNYPCDVLFVHRDAERQPAEDRRREIREAVERQECQTPVVCVVPVRMTEAWLLFDESAIRKASGNPNGRVALNLPRLTEVEGLPDPKRILNAALVQATELSARRGQRFPTSESSRRVIRHIDDFSPLRSLTAFRGLELEVAALMTRLPDRASGPESR